MGNVDLNAILRQYPGCTANRAKLQATLLDCCLQAEYRREINVILAIYESGILPKLQGKDSLTPFETASLCAQLENDYGISGEYAAEGLIAWGSARGVKISAAIPAKTAPPAKAAPRAAPPKPIAPVSGSVSEYVIEEREEGWFITKFQGFEQEDMTIPNVIDGKRIVGIGLIVFQGCRGINKVTVSDGIRFLKDSVFKNCSVAEVTLPATLVEIGENCFFQSGLLSLVIPDAVTEIGERAFNKSPLTSITLPKYLKVIRSGMLNGCIRLLNVILPEFCEIIESVAFKTCYSLREIRIPPSVVSIDDSAFSRYEEKYYRGTTTMTGLKTIYCAPGTAASALDQENLALAICSTHLQIVLQHRKQ